VISRILALTLAASAVGAVGAAGLVHVANATARPSALAVTAAKPYDFNGDGYADLAFGNPYGKVSGHSSAGFVSIVPGSSTGPATSKKKIFSQNSTGVPGSAEASDHFGAALTSLDIDRDGYADLIVGAPDEDTGAGVDAGSETILWGSPSGLTGTGSVSEGEPSNGSEGPGAGHRYGATMAEGDIDGDGYTDWISTAPGADFWWYLTTNPAATTARVRASTTRSFPSAKRGQRLQAKTTGRLAATAATTSPVTLIPAIADVNGDKAGDIVMGFSNPSVTDPSQRTGFEVYPSSPDGSVPPVTVFTPITSLTTGDFNGDGSSDVAVGYSGETGGTGGHVTVYPGDSTLSMATSTTFTQNSSGVPGTSAAGDHFGYSVAAGDFNGDGKDDLGVGVPYKTVSGQTVAGEAVALYGGASGLTGTGSQAFSQNTSGVAGSAEKNDSLGWTVSVLDVNRDKRGDLVTGAPKENGTDGGVSVLKGTATTLTGTGSWSFGSGSLGISGMDAQLGVRTGRKG
jgi:FG-GAP repeat